MKNQILFFLFLACIGASKAQNVNIPDANFKAKLIALGIDSNSDGQIQTSEASTVTNLNVSASTISDLTGIAGFINLDTLDCSNNQLTNLNVSALTSLTYLSFSLNQIGIFTATNTSLVNLYCSDNQLINLDVSACTNLELLYCKANMITDLDVSACLKLSSLYCYDNQLVSLFMKNGRNETNIYFHTNPNLQYVCVDASQVNSVLQLVSLYGMSNVVVNNFCSSIPGGNYNTVLGTTINDVDLNGCSGADPMYSFLMLGYTDGIDTNYVCSNHIGNYAIHIDTGTYTIIPKVENPSYYSSNPGLSTINFSNNNNNLVTKDFCIVPNGVFPDVEIIVVPLSNFVPGFFADYEILFHNKGTTVASGDITFDFMGNKLNYVISSDTPINQTANQITWNYSNLLPFQSQSILVTMHVLASPINNVNDILVHTANISLANDVYINDNTFTLPQTLIGSYDPNDKTCLEGDVVNKTKIGDYLHYLIRFQNVGNYFAQNVVVVDSIDMDKFDITTLQMLETSHNASVNMDNGVLQFYFENIMLADSFSNEPESHGYVVFKIKTKSSLTVNDTISNKAEIYFDYNLPVVTNTEITTFSNTAGISSGLKGMAFRCYPNPAENSLSIESGVPLDIVVMNVLGEVVMRKHIQSKESLDISSLPKGVYWIKDNLTSRGQKFVKE